MITKFKIFEVYSGAGKTIGFRYSDPKSSGEINHYKSVIVTDLIPSKEFRNNLTAAINSIELDATYEIEDEMITIEFYSYSLVEASKIHEEFLEFVKSSGYQIIDTFLSTPKGSGIMRKAGFRINQNIPEKDPEEPKTTRELGYNGVQLPKEVQKKEEPRTMIGYKNY